MVLNRLQSPSHYEALSCAVRLLKQDIKEKIPYVALDYEQEVETAKSSSAIKVTYELPNKALYVAKVEEHEKLQQLPGKTSASGVSSLICCDLKEECRSEDEAVQFYFQRLTMTTMLRRVVKRSVADFVFLVTTHHTHGILETFSYMFSLCCLGWKPMTKKLKFVA
ncbi:hypothetical protein YC2023_082865 [Brassica napus]